MTTATQPPVWLGLDIGGANLKAAHTNGWTNAFPFAMWKQHMELAQSLGGLLESAPAFCGVALTMTGELADCFESREHGVASILEQVTRILPASMVRVYCVDGTWRSVSQAARDPWLAAASNWHALATWVHRFVPNQSALLMDIGSTTTDLIPLVDGEVAMELRTDSQRLQSGTLVYTGIERSNVAGIVHQVPLYGKPCPVMNELFATTRDVYLWLEDLSEDADDLETADGKPATRAQARCRLARIVGEDGATLTDSDVTEIARSVYRAQVQRIATAVQQICLVLPDRTGDKKKKAKRIKGDSWLPNPFDCIVFSGHGDFLADAVLNELGWNCKRLSLREQMSPEVARCAPSMAVAILAAESFGESR